MAQINVSVGGRLYPLACRDGEEERLLRVAALVDARARDLTQTLGQMSEPRLLLMTAILLGDALTELQDQPPASDADLGDLAERLEGVAGALEAAVRSA